MYRTASIINISIYVNLLFYDIVFYVSLSGYFYLLYILSWSIDYFLFSSERIGYDIGVTR